MLRRIHLQKLYSGHCPQSTLNSGAAMATELENYHLTSVLSKHTGTHAHTHARTHARTEIRISRTMFMGYRNEITFNFQLYGDDSSTEGTMKQH